MSSTRYRKLKKGCLNVYKEVLILSKNEIFSPNDLYKVEEQSSELMTIILLRKIWDSIELIYLGKKEKNESGDTILIVKIHKDGSVLESGG